jgi:L-asparagine transporter-like permease
MSFNRNRFPRALSLSLALLLLCNFCLLNFPSLRAWMGVGVYHLVLGVMVCFSLLVIAMMLFYQRRTESTEANVSRMKFFQRRAGIPLAMLFLVFALLSKRLGFAVLLGENGSDFVQGLCFGISIAMSILTILANKNRSCDGENARD